MSQDIAPKFSKSSHRANHRDSQLQKLISISQWLVNEHLDPILICDRRLKPILMNDAAKAILFEEGPIQFNHRSLHFNDASYRNWQQIFALLDTQSLMITFTHRSMSYAGLIKKLPRIPSVNAELIAISLRVKKPEKSRGRTMRELFKLTNAEADIAEHIYNGLSLVRIARLRGASINTVKSQARQIFRKCSVSSQVTLTRRLSELQPARSVGIW